MTRSEVRKEVLKIIARAKALGISEPALAEKVGVTYKTIYCWKNGLYLPGLLKFRKLQEVIEKEEAVFR